jgi:hypothetical protein
MSANPRDERHRQLDGEHRDRRGNLDTPETRRTLQVAVRLARRTAKPVSHLTGGVRHRLTRVQQVRGRVDPLGKHVATSSATARRPTSRHVTNVLLNMSHALTDTPRSLRPAVAQRHLEAEVANCVGGVLSPLLANIALSTLDEYFAQIEGGPANREWERRKRRQRGQANYRLIRYADLWRVRHKSAYAACRVMPRRVLDVLLAMGLKRSHAA